MTSPVSLRRSLEPEAFESPARRPRRDSGEVRMIGSLAREFLAQLPPPTPGRWNARNIARVAPFKQVYEQFRTGIVEEQIVTPIRSNGFVVTYDADDSLFEVFTEAVMNKTPGKLSQYVNYALAQHAQFTLLGIPVAEILNDPKQDCYFQFEKIEWPLDPYWSPDIPLQNLNATALLWLAQIKEYFESARIYGFAIDPAALRVKDDWDKSQVVFSSVMKEEPGVELDYSLGRALHQIVAGNQEVLNYLNPGIPQQILDDTKPRV